MTCNKLKQQAHLPWAFGVAFKILSALGFSIKHHIKKHPNTAISIRHQYHKLNQRPISYLQTEATLYFKYDFHTYSTKQCIDSQI